MEEVHEEQIMMITEQFVAELEAGQQPRLADYEQRYPQYAGEIADFVTYYTVLEASALRASETVPKLSTNTQEALKEGWERVFSQYTPAEASLQVLAQRQQYSLTQLATRLDLSQDLVEQLARRQLLSATVPHELLQHLAMLLAQSIEVVRKALEHVAAPTLAEERPVYGLPELVRSTVPLPATFREALLNSSRLSAAQKERWLAILENEGL